MKGKKHTTEDKIRILRAADGGKSIVEICKEKNISEQTFQPPAAGPGRGPPCRVVGNAWTLNYRHPDGVRLHRPARF